MPKIEVEAEALDSLKRMVEELQQQRNSALGALMAIYKGGSTKIFSNRLSDIQMTQIAKSAIEFDAAMKND